MTKIMLVEDDKSLREIYSVRLVAEGYNIVSADDGEEALAMAVQEKPDLIIADVMMPKISGFDMLDILRSTPETANVKIIMMTALSGEDQRQRGESLGADRYVVKSQVGIEDVVAIVHEVLGDSANSSAQTYLGMVSSIANNANNQNFAERVAERVNVQPAAEANGRMMTAAPTMSGAASATTGSVMPAGAEGFESGQSIGGERVIQPINDPRLDQARAEMQRKMEEALNEGGGMMGMVDMSEIDKPAAPTPAATTTIAQPSPAVAVQQSPSELEQARAASAAVASMQSAAQEAATVQANVATSTSQAIAAQAPIATPVPPVANPGPATAQTLPQQAITQQAPAVAQPVVAPPQVAAPQQAVPATATPQVAPVLPNPTQAIPQAPVATQPVVAQPVAPTTAVAQMPQATPPQAVPPQVAPQQQA
ncbi:response regulator [Candidatus Saccharibacteria bacterium]|nr:response regulator [Candidatus Saccharibacteria bacterium]